MGHCQTVVAEVNASQATLQVDIKSDLQNLRHALQQLPLRCW